MFRCMCGGNHGARVAEAAIGYQKKTLLFRLENLPTFRFLYSEENVIKEPRRTPMYAKGRISPFQSIANIMETVTFPAVGEVRVYDAQR